MNLMDILAQGEGQAAVGQVARQFDLDQRDAQNAIAQLLPALTRGMQRNATQPGGIDALIGALAKANHQRYVDQPESLGETATIDDGNRILGHVLGSKDVSRNVAARASQETGINSDLLRRMLPVVATLAMGMLSKQAQAGRTATTPQSGNSMQDLLTQMLDTNQDGSVIDDVLNLATKFF